MRSLASRFSHFLGRLPQPSPAANRRRVGRKPRPARGLLRLEQLEDRAMMSGFNFVEFAGATGLNLVGDAAITPEGRLRLTPAAGGMLGAAWYTADKQFAGAAFETRFQFQLTENYDAPGGSDGFVFIFQNSDPTFANGGGGSLGYSGLPNSLAVEFDTYQNGGDPGDPSQSHISVHTNGTGRNGPSESLSLGVYDTSPALLDDTAVHSVKIAYTPGTLSVYLDSMTAPKLTVAVDMAEILDLDAGKAWVGFTAATGGGWQNHDILNWAYTVLPDVSTTLWVNNLSTVEGDSGGSNLVFTVTREGDTSGTTTVNWATEDRTATAGSDYTAAAGQVVFDPGVTHQTVSISIHGDTSVEPHETLALRLNGATGATVADRLALGTILTDDVTISIRDDSAKEASKSLKFLDRFVSDAAGGLLTPRDSVFGPDGNGDGKPDLYVASGGSHAILRYDAVSGEWIDQYVPSGSAGLKNPVGLAFGPDGRLYVSTGTEGKVFRFDASGAAGEVIVSGLTRALGLAFGPDGSLYIADADTDQVYRYNSSGLSVYMNAASGGGLDNPFGLAFGPDGQLYVASQNTGQVLRFNGTTGSAFTSAVPGLGQGPIWLEFGADGFLYTSSRTSSAGSGTSIVRFNASNGAWVDTFDLGRAGWSFSIGPDRLVYSSGNGAGDFVERLGPASWAAFEVSLSSASAAPISVNYATLDGTALAGQDFTATSGTLYFDAGVTVRTVLVNTIDDTMGEDRETFGVLLSSAVGGDISDGSAVGTIYDNDGTKFYVVEDSDVGTRDRTFEYADGGNGIENYVLDKSNTKAQGAASNAAGDTIWVADYARKVFVYNTGGGLKGSWTAGTMSKWARVAGIATNGVDVWLVDNYSRKVFKYSNAASRTSGSQNAASSFSLNSANTNPTDIVTDGTHLWVVDNDLTDKVYKYTLGGSLVSSWTIDPDNLNPRGITLDPTNPDHLWIVDANQRRVYEYAHAVNAASGSTRLADASFALDASNTHPEGIADPRPLVSRAPAAQSVAASPATTDLAVDGAMLQSLDGLAESLDNDLLRARTGAAWRTSGSQSADASFALAAGNTNPQGIADPPAAVSRPLGVERVEVRSSRVAAQSLESDDLRANRRRSRDLVFAAEQDFALLAWASDWPSDAKGAGNHFAKRSDAEKVTWFGVQ